MELQRFGYCQTFARYVWAILSMRGRVGYPDHIRHPPAPEASSTTPRAGYSSRPAMTTQPPGRTRRAAWLGPILEQVRLNRIERRRAPDGAPLIAKRRRWYARWLIGPGNLYLRWLGAGVVVLNDRQWQARERAVLHQLHGIEFGPDSQGWLILPEWPGVTVARYLADQRHSPADRLLALAASSRALHALHRVEIACPGDELPGVSHGDATLRNVHYDPESRQAYWFDFDTSHLPSVPPIARHADDLRALLYSALEAGNDLPVADLYHAIRRAYTDARPWNQLHAHLRSRPLHHTPFHFAQANPSHDRRGQLERLLQQG